MNEVFVFKLILSFAVGVIWIWAVMALAQKFNARLGGAVAGIPATMVIALLFIGITQSARAAVASTVIIPLVVGINALMVVVYVAARKKLPAAPSLFMALCAWLAFAIVVRLLPFNQFSYSFGGYVVLAVLSYLALEYKIKIISVESAVTAPLGHLLIRSLAAGAIITAAVLGAKLGGPWLGGTLASFPALTVALIILAEYQHGAFFTSALLKNFIITGTINVMVYVAVLRYAYLAYGLIYGTLMSFAASLVSAYLLYGAVNKRLR